MMDLDVLYDQATDLFNELSNRLSFSYLTMPQAQRYARLRDGLHNWLCAADSGRARWCDGVEAVQQALDVLYPIAGEEQS